MVRLILVNSVQEYSHLVEATRFKFTNSPYLDPGMKILFRYAIGDRFACAEPPLLLEYHIDESARSLPQVTVEIIDRKEAAAA